MRRSLDESLERLKLDYIDLIICHDIEYVDINIVVNEALPVLFEAKKAGKVGFVGVSGLPLAIYDKVLSKVELDFILSYCHHNLQDQTLIPMLQGFADKGIGVINASPLSMGLLTEQGPPVWHPAPPSIREACAKAAAYCKSHGVSLPQMGLAFASSNPLIAATLSGVGNTKELAQNLAVLDYKTDPEVLKGVTAILAPVFGMTWQSGLAENN